jgi:predicted ATPase/DNA-binding CsgD family transcriptional regulator
LLVLDNCEHVVRVCAQLAEILLRSGAGLRILATSREPLRALGEARYVLAPFPRPELPQRESFSVLMESDAVSLFVERARAQELRFAATPQNIERIAAICRSLDGLPLAIELAAALVPSLDLADLATLLDRAQPVLVRGGRAVQRHETLRAALSWSHALLPEEERVLFRRLALFRSSFDLRAVVGICGLDDIRKESAQRNRIAMALSALVDKSLVVAIPGANGMRYRLLEPLRLYASELLEESGERAILAACHARYFTEYAETCAPSLSDWHRSGALDTLAPELDNLRAVLNWALQSDEGPTPEQQEIGLRLATSLFGLWHFAGPRSEGLRWLRSALRWRYDHAIPIAARALYAAGELAWLLGESVQARVWLAESIELWRTLGDERSLAYALQALAPLLEGETGWNLARESEALFHKLGDSWGSALVAFDFGLLAMVEGDLAAARMMMEAACTRFQALGDEWFVAQVLNNLGDVARMKGHHALAERRYARALTLLERHGDMVLLPSVLHNLGIVAVRRGHMAQARRFLQQALLYFRDRADPRGVAECLVSLAAMLSAAQPERAARLLGAAEALFNQSAIEVWMANREEYARARTIVAELLSPIQLDIEYREGERLSFQDVISTATADSGSRSRATPSSSPNAFSPFERLTAREQEVATLLMRGYTNRQIATALVVAPGTATLHVKHILHKLGCATRAEAAAHIAAALRPSS